MTPIPEKWEAEFDKKFDLVMQGCSECGGDHFEVDGQTEYDLDKVKSFIRQLREEAISATKQDILEAVDRLKVDKPRSVSEEVPYDIKRAWLNEVKEALKDYILKK